MSDDEGFVLFLCGLITLVAWAPLVFAMFAMRRRLRSSSFSRGLLLGLPAVVTLALAAMLQSWADVGVRESTVYLGFYLVMGLAWIGGSVRLLDRLGLSVRDDVLERNNVPAALAIYGATVGITLAFAGGNFGDGPGWWVVIFTAALGLASLAVLWLVLDKLTWIADRITIDRNPGAAVHAGLLFIAWGTLAMRASAGDWLDAVQTTVDFAPALLPMGALLALAVVVEGVLRPRRAAGSVALPLSIGVGLAELAVAVAWVVWRGWW